MIHGIGTTQAHCPRQGMNTFTNFLQHVFYWIGISTLKSFAVHTILLLLLQNTQPNSANRPSEPHKCFRPCKWPSRPLTCRYEFTLEWYHTMSTACYDCPANQTDCNRPHCIPVNGVPRTVAVVNRQFPGPSIEVCEWDTIEVKVENNLVGSEGVTIHWHGLHQRGTPHMDGTPLITQCPIPFGSSFTYRFQALTPGTYFWHSHGLQRPDGAVGTLIIRTGARDDVLDDLYDHDLSEHVIIVQDWINQLYIDRYARIAFHDMAKSPDSILINGRGRYRDFLCRTPKRMNIPRHAFHVKKGERYRFRTIGNSAMACAFEVSVDGHNLTIIGTDGSPVQPIRVGAFGISSGERYDFVLEARARIGKYWMRVKGRDACMGMHELALVVYEGASYYPDPPDEKQLDSFGTLLNPYNIKAEENQKYTSVLNANELNATRIEISRDPDIVHYVGIDMPLVNTNYYTHPRHSLALQDNGDRPTTTGLFSAQINHVSFRPPKVPLLTQSREIPRTEICRFEKEASKIQRCKNEYCECTHVLEVELGQVVELVIVNEAQRNFNAHPMHLHGNRFQVLAADKVANVTSVEEVMRLDEAGQITRRILKAPLKDTISVPDGGYVIIRFLADNPGWWLFHCHTEVHLSAGMSMVIRVGSEDNLPRLPSNLPRCGGDWYPPDLRTLETTATP
ncbi:laccase-like [Acanthaster planci]|uniref:Laccase-like n=1 Tax=Acanthaster planci TaxID=133434 RepID=A0A8B7YV98_ACAPL|nr:laccase-like [Acanthaster planci]